MSQVIKSDRSNAITADPINSSTANNRFDTDFDSGSATVLKLKSFNSSNDNHVNNTGENFRANETKFVDPSSPQTRSSVEDCDNHTNSEQSSIQSHDSAEDAGIHHNAQVLDLSNLSDEEIQMELERRFLATQDNGNLQQSSVPNGYFHQYGSQNSNNNRHFYQNGGSHPFPFQAPPPFHSGGPFAPPHGYQMPLVSRSPTPSHLSG